METGKINAIRRYLRQNGIKYYDVQAELIDHFATAVEKEERENPSIRFKVALLKTHRAFGGKEGFRKYLEKSREEVSKKTFWLIGKTLLRFLSWPYIVLTAFTYLCWWFMLSNGIIGPLYADYYLIFLSGFLVAFLCNEIYLRKIEWYLPKKANRSLGWVFYIAYYLPAITLHAFHFGIAITASFFTLLTVLMICIVMVPRIMTREVKKIYQFQ